MVQSLVRMSKKSSKKLHGAGPFKRGYKPDERDFGQSVLRLKENARPDKRPCIFLSESVVVTKNGICRQPLCDRLFLDSASLGNDILLYGMTFFVSPFQDVTIMIFLNVSIRIVTIIATGIV